MRKSQKTPETITTIGIDLGKNTFHLVGLDKRGAIALQRKVSRSQLELRLSNVPRCLIGMEACSGSHHIGQGVVLRRQGRCGPDRRKRLPRRTLSCSAELGGAGVPQADSLQQAPQRWALCGLGTAEALFRRGSRGLQIAAVG